MYYIDIIIDNVVLNRVTMASLFAAQPLPRAKSKHSPGSGSAPFIQRIKKYMKADRDSSILVILYFCVIAWITANIKISSKSAP